MHKKIAEILLKRKQKVLDLAHGENKVILNKNVSHLSPFEKNKMIGEKKVIKFIISIIFNFQCLIYILSTLRIKFII